MQSWEKPKVWEDGKIRCGWASHKNPLYVEYHDKEWGRPNRDDRHLFEMLILEGAQAGLSWETILNKRASYRKAFAGFDPVKVSRFGARDVKRLLGNAGIVRNRLKISSSIGNAKAFLEVQKEFVSFHKYLWGFVGGKPLKNKFRTIREVPARTEISDALSKDLKKRGFRFVGSTICYAYMQAIGMVDDHTLECFLRRR